LDPGIQICSNEVPVVTYSHALKGTHFYIHVGKKKQKLSNIFFS